MYDLATSFQGKEKDEAVYIFARPYFFAFLPTVAVFAFIFILSGLIQLGIAANQIPAMDAAWKVPTILTLGLFQVGGVVVFFTAILEYYCDILIVTDRRVVEIEQEQLFYRHISELNVLDVEDTNSTIKGFFPTLLGFGIVNVQTAGEKENFTSANLRYPREITAIISELAQQAKDGLSPHERSPDNSKIIAVIDNKPVTSMEQLAASGAIMTDDPRRSRKHSNRNNSAQSNPFSPDQSDESN